jgi:tungstate transport system substrate-binding protein
LIPKKENTMQRRSILALVLGVALAAPLAHAQGDKVLRLSTTTSTENSGLLGYLLPSFEAKTGIKVNVISVGTGKALELGKNGDVDVTLVHARALEDKFVAEGWGMDRRDVMYNDFIVAGPVADPARVKGNRDVIDAFRKIAAGNVKFISRGDNSGTDVMEKDYWKTAGVKPAGTNYVSAGLGMGEVLNMAAEMGGYTLTDRATYGAYKAKTGLAILVEGDKRMFNPYGIIAVNPEKHKGINYKGATALIEWITSAEGQARIASFKPAGEQLFFPSARR